jgi:hypothetical protein
MTMLSTQNALGPAVPAEMRKQYVAGLAQRFSGKRAQSGGETAFKQRLESHLSDVKNGRPWRSLPVNSELRERHSQNRKALADLDPDALRMYVGLISGMDYTHQARLASTVFSMSRGLGVLLDAGRQLDALKSVRINRYA